ncbi:zinc transport system ATP-binding protein [Pseudobutyrivibrio sp. YE44]|uniref:metal ABC transporter ATP-binding protein n=1 Tax=Pseudobutyrivibrio sp. YE44 TaxID=1520802 RepID=UPI000884CED3|nr:ABC transporter ATP-binding protein [Pseudobutyrivibrio sp. YE44]SDB15352.1 zinc transport system ATP-binding protein [Pseudobutyrivibrio sp. YE44]
MSLINITNLKVGYEGQPVLSDINLKIEAGDYLCIVGENGSGKSTLMKTILGLQAPISGKIEFSDGLAQTEIGYLPQQSDVQRDFPASVFEIVLSGCQSRLGRRFFYTKEHKAIAEENIKKLGIAKLKKRCYRELSGGQQQRVLLARALCATKRILLLDEPVAGLDPQVTEEMYELIKQLNDEGLTIIMISHDIANVQTYATKVFDVNKISPAGSAVLGGESLC